MVESDVKTGSGSVVAARPDRLEAPLDFGHRLSELSRELLGIGDSIAAEARGSCGGDGMRGAR